MNRIGSRWEWSVPKDEFKRRVKSGDVTGDISRAHQMIMDLYENEEKYISPRYKGASSDEKISWLTDHIQELSRGVKDLEYDDEIGKKDRFIGDHFDMKVDRESDVDLPEPPLTEY